MVLISRHPLKPLRGIVMICLGLFLSSCNPTELTPSGSRANITTNTDGSLDNKAYIYEEGWYLRTRSNYGPSNPDLSDYLSRTPAIISLNNNLTANCSIPFSGDIITECLRVHGKDTTEGALKVTGRQADKTYIFPVHSSEFYQTNTLYHLNLATTKFFEKLDWIFNTVRFSIPVSVPKSMPYYLRNSKMFWFTPLNSTENRNFSQNFLRAFSDCTLEGNASFSQVGPTLCFGSMKNFPGFYFVQDPSVIYHELGHGFVSILLNLRNGTGPTDYHPLRSDMGRAGYDEAGSINEGIADYFSYIFNQRESMGEWALGKTFSQSRALTESHPMHIEALSETSEGRLSYPQFLHYDPNHPDELLEDVHYAGQIVTHYLVALTKAVKLECSPPDSSLSSHDYATNQVLLLLSETLSEVGDLNARGIDNGQFPQNSAYFSNLDKDNSYLWTSTVNPVNFRRFFQIFGKNMNKYFPYLCPSLDKNKAEKLLDDYGLLLYKTYNDDGDSTKSTLISQNLVNSSLPYLSAPTTVSENNRRKTVLISKALMNLAEKDELHPNRVGHYIIDNNSDISSLISALLFKGFPVPLSSGVAGVEFNNNNIKVSPGEVVGIIPNLVNNSNSTMAGVQVLATDWDHVSVDPQTGYYKPCVVDSATTVDQGGESANTCTSTLTNFKRTLGEYASGSYPTDVVAPVCMVLLEEGNSSRWVSQNEFRKKQGLSITNKDCLGYSITGTSDTDFSFNPNECLARFLPGGNSAQFSKIEPQKTYYESYTKDAKTPLFNPGNILLLEVNKWIPPGTKFRCRLRARFSNCSDCFTDSLSGGDDFIDSEYNGSRPYKIINFDFDIND